MLRFSQINIQHADNYDSLCGQKTCNFKLHHSSGNYKHKSGIPVRNDLNLYFLVFGNEDVAEVYR